MKRGREERAAGDSKNEKTQAAESSVKKGVNDYRHSRRTS